MHKIIDGIFSHAYIYLCMYVFAYACMYVCMSNRDFSLDKTRKYKFIKSQVLFIP